MQNYEKAIIFEKNFAVLRIYTNFAKQKQNGGIV